MSRTFFGKLLLLTASALVAVGNCWAANLPSVEKPTEWTAEKDIFVAMRDGIHLNTDVYLPKGATGKLPTVLVRTPYDSEWPIMQPFFEGYLRNGYALVLQNERGFGFSEGHFENYLQGSSTDGYDTVEWLLKQPWSNGKVGSIGSSSSGETQWPMAASNPPGFAAMIPMAYGTSVGDVPGNDTRGALYRGGVHVLNAWLWWYGGTGQSERFSLPANSTQGDRNRWRDHFTLNPAWKSDFDMALLTNFSGTGNERRLMQLPSREIMKVMGAGPTPFSNYLTWMPGDPRWSKVEQIGAGAKPRVPALHVDTWHDGLGIGETTRLFKYLQDLRTPNQYLIIGPGAHGEVTLEELRTNLDFDSLKNASKGNPDLKVSALASGSTFGDFEFDDLKLGDARYGGIDHGYAKLFQRWFDYWLKGEQNHVTQMPKVQLFVMGKGWISGDQWPLAETRFTKYFLDSKSDSRSMKTGVLSAHQAGREEQDHYLYDPDAPTPTLGGGCCWHVALDQRPVESRKDVLVFSTPELEKAVTIAGPVQVVLYVSSSAKDTDFMVKLVDVYPDGKAVNLADDAFRVRYREGFNKQLLMEPGQVYKITLPNMVTSIKFPRGHRIRLDISSSNFPLYERNLNTGGNNYDETTWVLADNSVHHGGKYPSHVVLPVLPE